MPQQLEPARPAHLLEAGADGAVGDVPSPAPQHTEGRDSEGSVFRLILLRDGTLWAAQLHGNEDEDYIEKIQNMTGKPVIKAFSIKTPEDVKRALRSPGDYILLDQGAGGTGETFDWDLVPPVKRPFFLAGGLAPENLRTAIAKLHPWAVDISSSLETDGKKDPAKIRQLSKMLKQINTLEAYKKEREADY